MAKTSIPTLDLCPCGGGKPYKACCQLLHTGTSAPTAEELMRSRYTAYVLQLEDYLLHTWHPDTRPAALNLAADEPVKWLGLRVLNFEPMGELATVEFEARYKLNGKAEKLHEISSFKKLNSKWYYVDGKFHQSQPSKRDD